MLLLPPRQGSSWYSMSLCSNSLPRLSSTRLFLCLFVLSCLLRADVISLMQAPDIRVCVAVTCFVFILQGCLRVFGDDGVSQVTDESRMLPHWSEAAKGRFRPSYLAQTDVQVNARWEGWKDGWGRCLPVLFICIIGDFLRSGTVFDPCHKAQCSAQCLAHIGRINPYLSYSLLI